MFIKSFEKPLIDFAMLLATDHAKLINHEYTLSIKELNTHQQLHLLDLFFERYQNAEHCIQQYIDEACLIRTRIESQGFGGIGD